MNTATNYQNGFRIINGKLGVIALRVNDPIPAGASQREGVARSPDGYLYVVFK